jgi:dipeptidyl aminopeptidase/acylaminoacyl peptidase
MVLSPMEGAFTVKRLLDAGRVQAIALAPSGTYAVVEVARHDKASAALVSHLHRVEIETGKTTQLTAGPHGCRAPAFRADGALAFLTTRPVAGYVEPADDDEDDGKYAQVWVMPEHGEAHPVTDEPLGVSSFRFAKNADVLVVLTHVLPGVDSAEQRTTARDIAEHGPTVLRYGSMPARQWDHWIGRAAPHLVVHDSRGRRDLTPAADRELREWALPQGYNWTLSPDGRFVVSEWQSIGSDRIPNVRLVAIDIESLAMRDLARVDPLGFATTPVLSRDGKTLACNVQKRSPERYGKVELAIVDVQTGTLRIAGGDLDRWLAPADFTPDGTQIIATADTDAMIAVFAIDVAKGTVSRVTSPDAGGCHVSVEVHPDGRSIVGLRHTLLHPPEPFQVPLKENSEPFVIARVSGVETQDYDVLPFDTKMEDGVVVQSLLVKPKGVARPPVLFWIHGGPVGQFSDGWHWRWCPLVFASEGFAVVLPNPRGSTGRGQAFVEGVWGNSWGATCYRDLMTVADAVAVRNDVDGKSMGAMGGSFGGYMSNWIGSQTDRFACIVTHASVFHLEQFAQTTDIPAWFFLESGLAPPEDRDELDRYSPHRHVASWRTPTLVIHGEKDYRVPISEALSLFESLQRRNVESELVVFPDEGHWIMRPRNVAVWYEAVTSWVTKYLKRDG